MRKIILTYGLHSIGSLEDRFVSLLIKPLFVVFIYFGLFSRTFGIFGITGGLVSVMVSVVLFGTAVLHLFLFRKNYHVSQFTWLLIIFFGLLGVGPLLASFFFAASPSLVLRYSIEIGISLFMFLSVYYFVKEKVITPRFFLYTLAVLGLLVSIQLIVNVLTMVALRRADTLSGLNYMGNSFAMSTFAWIVILYKSQKLGYSLLKRGFIYTALFISILALFMTGTRASMLALLIGLLLYQYFGLKSRRFNRYLLISAGAMVAALVIVALNVDLTMLLNRFTWAELNRMAGIRMEIYILSIADLTAAEFTFGRPDLYLFSDDDSGERFVNPHNIYLALIRFNGVYSFVVFTIITLILFDKLMRLYVMNKEKEPFRTMEATLLVFFVIVLIYTLFSGGRITRIFAFFITLGYITGYLEMMKSVAGSWEYEKLLYGRKLRRSKTAEGKAEGQEE